MEKLKNHYSLADIQAQMMTVPAMNLTGSARDGIRQAGMAQTDASVWSSRSDSFAPPPACGRGLRRGSGHRDVRWA